MTGVALFGRTVEVLLGTTPNPAQARYGNATAAASALRIAFSVKKGLKSAPNVATVTLYNMAPERRVALVPGMLLTLSAGYGDRLQALFIGVVTKVKSQRDGASISTTLECLDGGSAVTQTTFHRSYAEGTTLAQVLQDVAGAMQLRTAANPTGITAGIAVGIPADVFPNGYTAYGMTRDILTELLRPRGLEWSIQNGALTIVPLEHHSGDTAVVLTAQTGLIGIPSLNRELLTCESLLNPAIRPASVLFIESRDVRGFFKVRGGTWEGDTHGEKWQCALEAVSLPNVAEVLPSAQGFNYLTATAVA